MLIFHVQLKSEQAELDEANKDKPFVFGDMLSAENTAPLRECMYYWGEDKGNLAVTDNRVPIKHVSPQDCSYVSVKSNREDGLYDKQDVTELIELTKAGYKIDRILPWYS